MKAKNTKEAIARILDNKDCFTSFWEHFDGSDIDTVVSELDKREANYLIIKTDRYIEETLKYLERFEANGIPSCWYFREDIRSVDVLVIYGYETIGLYQELFETMIVHDINSRKGLLKKTVLATSGSFDSVISEKLKNMMTARTILSC